MLRGIALAAGIFALPSAWGAAGAAAARCGDPADGKRVLEYVGPAALAVQVPGGPIDLAPALGGRLVTEWTRSGRWIVTDPPRLDRSKVRMAEDAAADGP